MTRNSVFPKARVLVAVGSAGAIALALSACTPDEPPTDAKGTTPAVITGSQADPDQLYDADAIPQETGASSELADAAGEPVGSVTMSPADTGLSVTVTIDDGSGLDAGSYSLAVHDGSACGGEGFAEAGAVAADGTLVGINVLDNGSGRTSTISSLKLEDVGGKTLVVSSGGERVACGEIEEQVQE